MSYDSDDVRARLDARDHRRIFQKCGFEINGQSGPELSGILGPKALGEGESGNFSVDLQDGLVKDWGSSGYEGDVLNVVMDVHGLDFNEALEWIVDELNLDVESDGRSNGQSTGASSPESNRPPNEESKPEPVVSHDQVEWWNERLMSDTDPAQAARSYLTEKRGLHPHVVKIARVGLARENEIPDDWRGWFEPWWIVFAVPQRDLDGTPIVAVKGVAFDPGARDWKRDSNGDKIPRNASSALWDLVPTEDDGEPRIDGPVVLCEGEIDGLCAVSHGFNAVTGTAGAGTFKPEWARYVARLAPAQNHGVVVAFDGDEKGRKWGPEHAETLCETGIDVRVASLPDGRDVNDLLVSGGRNALESHLAQAESFPATEEAPASEETVERAEAEETEQDSGLSYEPFPFDALPGPGLRAGSFRGPSGAPGNGNGAHAVRPVRCYWRRCTPQTETIVDGACDAVDGARGAFGLYEVPRL